MFIARLRPQVGDKLQQAVCTSLGEAQKWGWLTLQKFFPGLTKEKWEEMPERLRPGVVILKQVEAYHSSVFPWEKPEGLKEEEPQS